MQQAFEAQDLAGLDAALAALPPAEADAHMGRCVACGLWVPAGESDDGVFSTTIQPPYSLLKISLCSIDRGRGPSRGHGSAA
jgi:hypothetical protein